MTRSDHEHVSRKAFLRGAAATGAGVGLAGARVEAGLGASVAGTCTDTVPSMLSRLLIMERLATTFYYTALTSPAVMRNRQLGGSSSDPNNPGLPPDGNPHHVRYLQAALDAERRHAALLARAGARAVPTHFYFPRATFTEMGTSTEPDTFLGVLDELETASVGAYLAAASNLASPQHADLVGLTAAIAGVEAEHRLLGRVLAGIAPANNLTLEREPFACVSEAHDALQPFLTGKGFAGGATHPIALPTTAQINRVVRKYGTLRVRRYL